MIRKTTVGILKSEKLTYRDVGTSGLWIFEQVRQSLKRLNTNLKKPTVFLLCNFVQHRRDAESPEAFLSKTTQVGVLKPLIEAIFDSFGMDTVIRIGNAPLQSAIWTQIISDLGLRSLCAEDIEYPKIEFCDLRMSIRESVGRFGVTKEVMNVKNSSDIVCFDLKKTSSLDEVCDTFTEYGIYDYDDKRILACHGPGRHIYMINRKILEADLIISIPKLKTHEKVGMTGAIKGCVGAVAHKDCLAHYRKGSPESDGDEFPQRAIIGSILSQLNTSIWSKASSPITNALKIAERIVTKLYRLQGFCLAGSWRGNDTAWRMAIDLAKILKYGTGDGQMEDRPVRKHYVLMDGIVAGEGQGPLRPDPVQMGYMSWSEDIVASDFASAVAMGIEPSTLKIISKALKDNNYHITEVQNPNEIYLNTPEGKCTWEKFKKNIAQDFKMPRGW